MLRTQAHSSNLTQPRVSISSKPSLPGGLATLLFIVLLAFLSIYLLKPPAAVPESAPATEFSSGRAMKQLAVISRQPHPIGSSEHAVVRDYLQAELNALGLKPEVQKTTVADFRWGDSFRAGTVENVVARLEGTERGKAILLAAHYDSVPTSYGASDDGSGVATLLETAHALKNGARLRNDVIFLFTDGEEVGMLGARAFVNEHPWAKDVGLVLNFEARGNGGSAVMFETSIKNGWIINEFAKAAPRPVANSLSYDIYRLLPNDTDFTVFRYARWQGLNFAYIDGLNHYHTSLDNIQRINEGSLQHDGSYALALTRHFGNLSLNNNREPNSVYFDLLGRTMVSYSPTWAFALTALIVLMCAGVIFYGFKRGRLSVAGIALGFVVLLLNIVAASVLVLCVRWLTGALQRGFDAVPQGDTGHSTLYMLGLAALVLASTSFSYIRFQKKIGGANLTLGGLLFLLVLLVLSHLYLPGGSYLLAWPLLFSFIALGYLLATREENRASLETHVVVALCAVPAVVLLSPLIYQLFVALGLSAAAALGVLIALLLAMILPQLNLAAVSRRWLLPGVAATASMLLIVAAIAVSGVNRDHPRQNSVFYALNADTEKAIWVSSDERQDEWSSQFFTGAAQKGALTEYLPWPGESYLKGDAPVASVNAPEVSVLEDKAENGGRLLRLRVSSPRQAAVMSISVDATVQQATVNGKPVREGAEQSESVPGKNWTLHYCAPPAEGIELTLSLKSMEPIRMVVVDESRGLPELPGSVYKPRPEHTISSPVLPSDLTFVRKTFTLKMQT
jgi:hypothetical protein